MKKFILSILLLIFALSLQAQCMCADLYITVPLPDVKIKKNKSNYQIQIIKKYTFRDDIEKLPEQNFPVEFLNSYHFRPAKDTLHYNFATGGGLAELTFKIIRLEDNAEMQITALNMTYDNPYELIFDKFTAGNFVFNWSEIDSCQRENIDNLQIICNGKRLEQDRLLNEGERKYSFMRNLVKVSHPQDFIAN